MMNGMLKRSRSALPWRFSENTVLLVLAVSLGLTTAFGVWLFREGIDLFQRFFREGLLHNIAAAAGTWAFLGIIPILALAGLIVGLIMNRFIGEERHHGVAGIMEAAALAGGRLRYRRMPIKAILASFSLGAGASVGPEDPSVQIGANLGSLFGQRLHLSDERVRLLVAAGAAGGIAAAFRAPIAGVFFALEVILGDFSTGAFGVVVLTSVIASVMTRAIEAGGLVFHEATIPELGIAAYTLGGFQEIPLYVILGVIMAPVSALFIRMLYWQHDLWHHMKFSRSIKTMLAGALVGILALFLPQILGTGRETLNAMLNARSADFTLNLLLAMALAKMVATTISVGGGFVGGMFAPSLFVGAAMGRAFGEFLRSVVPGELTADPAAFAIAGMAAAMTGVIRSPITAILLLFELTNDYNLILPIMLTTVVCLIVVERLAPDGIYHLGLTRKGIRLSRGRDIDLMQTVTVGEAMTTTPDTVPTAMPLPELEQIFRKTNTHGLAVVDSEGLLCGVVSLQDLARTRESGEIDGKQTVADICTHDVITATPDMPIAEALRLIGARDLGRLPVVEADNSRKIVGVLRRRDIVRAYDLAIQRKLESEQKNNRVRLETYSRARILELQVEAGALAEDRQIREIAWPVGTIVATVHRRGQVIVPHGDTILRAQDMLTIVTTPERQIELSKLLKAR